MNDEDRAKRDPSYVYFEDILGTRKRAKRASEFRLLQRNFSIFLKRREEVWKVEAKQAKMRAKRASELRLHLNSLTRLQ